MDNWTCAYCGVPASVIDHVNPVSNDGRNVYSNLVASCVACNYKKGAHVDLDMMARGFLVIAQRKERMNCPEEYTTKITEMQNAQNVGQYSAVFDPYIHTVHDPVRWEHITREKTHKQKRANALPPEGLLLIKVQRQEMKMFHKKCVVCREIKPNEMFYKNSTLLDGHEKKCKKCRKMERRQRYEDTMERKSA